MSVADGQEPADPGLVVCIATFRRPEGLAEAVASIAEGTGPVSRLVIIDNDADASARPVVDRLREEGLPWPVTYEVEPERGLSAVRNHAVDTALRSGAELVAFLDDDSLASPGWAAALVATHRRTGADVVTGRVDFGFVEQPPAWLAGFYSLPVHPDGAEIPYAVTGNVLLTARVLRSVDPVFDPRYGLTGGEDSHLFERLRLQGTSIVYAADARITEIVPPHRVGVRWVLEREHWRGTMLSVVLRDLDPPPYRYAKRLAAGLVHIALGLLGCTFVWRGRRGLLDGVRRIALGSGLVVGLLGRRPERYATPK